MEKYVSLNEILKLQTIYSNGVPKGVRNNITFEELKQLKLEDVIPAIHAKWEPCKNGFGYECTNCKKFIVNITKELNYCSKCGAKMDLK